MKYDLPSNNPTILAKYNQYTQLYLQASKTESETTLLNSLQSELSPYLTTASDINAFISNVTDLTQFKKDMEILYWMGDI